MCGIAAMYAYAGTAPPVDLDALGRMRDRMAARGPDGEGSWVADDGRVALAHRRLSIIDLSDAAAQPMRSADGRFVISYNGEIYNYRALRRELAQQGVEFRSESDTEVILELYRRDGARVAESLRGMYAFAIWDSERRELFLARDPYGIKPLYLSDDGGTVRVASQVKALLAGGGIDTRPAPAGHAGFFLLGAVPEPWTLYRGIRALPAGHTMSVRQAGARPAAPYFDFAEELRAGAENPAGKDPIDAEELREALTDSVVHHLVSDVPVGVFLSSGLDSTTLAGLAAEVSPSPLGTVTLGFDAYRGTENDETPLAEAVGALYGTAHRTDWIARDAFAASYDALLDAMDQPSTDGTNTYFVSRAAADAGFKVAISGLGGDELFGGYSTFTQVPRLVRAAGAFGALPSLCRGLRRISAPAVARFTSPKYAGLLEYGTSYDDAYLLRRALYMPWELPGILDPDLAREGWAEIAPRLRQTSADPATPHARIAALESAWYMRNQLLRDADWAGMAHSLEIRVPLVDSILLRRLAPWVAGPHPPGKLDMAAAPETPLPGAVLSRSKTGFAVPIRDWLAGEAGAERGLRGWAHRVYARQWSV